MNYKTMNKFEYRIIRECADHFDADLFNEYGEDGWELVSYSEYYHIEDKEIYYGAVFKRLLT